MERRNKYLKAKNIKKLKVASVVVCSLGTICVISGFSLAKAPNKPTNNLDMVLSQEYLQNNLEVVKDAYQMDLYNGDKKDMDLLLKYIKTNYNLSDEQVALYKEIFEDCLDNQKHINVSYLMNKYNNDLLKAKLENSKDNLLITDIKYCNGYIEVYASNNGDMEKITINNKLKIYDLMSNMDSSDYDKDEYLNQLNEMLATKTSVVGSSLMGPLGKKGIALLISGAILASFSVTCFSRIDTRKN